MTSVRRIDGEAEYTKYESDEYKRDSLLAAEENLRPSPSCLKCSHMPVCKIFGNVQPMMHQLYGMLQEKDQPFKGDDLAKICRYYKNREDEELR